MKFQDSNFNGWYKKRDPRNHARTLQKQYAPSTFSKLGAYIYITQIFSIFQIETSYAASSLKDSYDGCVVNALR